MNTYLGYSIQNNSDVFVKLSFENDGTIVDPTVRNIDVWLSNPPLKNRVLATYSRCSTASVFRIIKYNYGSGGVCGSQNAYCPQSDGYRAPLMFGDTVYLSSGDLGSPCVGYDNGSTTLKLTSQWAQCQWLVAPMPNQPYTTGVVGPGMPFYFAGMTPTQSFYWNFNSQDGSINTSLNYNLVAQLIPENPIAWGQQPGGIGPNKCAVVDSRTSLAGAQTVCTPTLQSKSSFASCLKLTKPNLLLMRNCQNYQANVSVPFTSTNEQPFNSISDCNNIDPQIPSDDQMFVCGKAQPWITPTSCPGDSGCCRLCTGLTNGSCKDAIQSQTVSPSSAPSSVPTSLPKESRYILYGLGIFLAIILVSIIIILTSKDLKNSEDFK